MQHKFARQNTNSNSNSNISSRGAVPTPGDSAEDESPKVGMILHSSTAALDGKVNHKPLRSRTDFGIGLCVTQIRTPGHETERKNFFTTLR